MRKLNFLRLKKSNSILVQEKLKKFDLLSSQNLQAHMNECIIFVTDIASKLFGRSPLGSVIVRNADALNPKVIADLEAHKLERKMN